MSAPKYKNVQQLIAYLVKTVVLVKEKYYI